MTRKFKTFCVLCIITLFVFSFSNCLAYTSNYAEPTITLKRGMQGSYVKWLQDMLNHSGYNLTVDGIFGNNTYNAVISFQAKTGIGVDGIVGNQTRTTLKNYVNKTTSTTLPKFSRTSSSLTQIIKNCKSYYATNNFYYSQAAGVRTIPADNSKTYDGKRYVDCSSYVSWCLYEYARANGKTAMQNYFSTQKTSSNFITIGANGGNSYLSVVAAKTPSSVVNLASAREGDILVSNGHVEFFQSYIKESGNAVSIKVYNCGSDSSIKVNGVTTSATKDVSKILYILRVK